MKKLTQKNIISFNIDKINNEKNITISLIDTYEPDDYDFIKNIYKKENFDSNDIVYINYNELYFHLDIVTKTINKKDLIKILNEINEKNYPIEKEKKEKEIKKIIKQEKFDDYLVDLENKIRQRIQDRLINEFGKENAFLFLNNKDIPLRFNMNNTLKSISSHSVKFARRELDSYKNEEKIKIVKQKVQDLIKNNKYIKNIQCRLDWKHDYIIELTEDASFVLNKIMIEETNKFYKENGLNIKSHKKINNKKKLTS